MPGGRVEVEPVAGGQRRAFGFRLQRSEEARKPLRGARVVRDPTVEDGRTGVAALDHQVRHLEIARELGRRPGPEVPQIRLVADLPRAETRPRPRTARHVAPHDLVDEARPWIVGVHAAGQRGIIGGAAVRGPEDRGVQARRDAGRDTAGSVAVQGGERPKSVRRVARDDRIDHLPAEAIRLDQIPIERGPMPYGARLDGPGVATRGVGFSDAAPEARSGRGPFEMAIHQVDVRDAEAPVRPLDRGRRVRSGNALAGAARPGERWMFVGGRLHAPRRPHTDQSRREQGPGSDEPADPSRIALSSTCRERVNLRRVFDRVRSHPSPLR